MRDPMVDDVVCLTTDVPNLNLRKGQTGVVRSLWFAPSVAFEVEFSIGLDERTRAVLMRGEVVVEGGEGGVAGQSEGRREEHLSVGAW